jgi:photosystem II biogenesis protein Psp29
VSNCGTVADSKRRFYGSYPRVIPGLYRRLVDELLVELHLLSCQKGFHPDALFALGLTQVFDNFMAGFQPAERRQELFAALCIASQMDENALRESAQSLQNQLAPHGENEIRQWLTAKGAEGPELLKNVLLQANREDFHYSRLHAVGLVALLEELGGGNEQDPEALRLRARQLGELMGLQEEKLDKDMGLYARNLEKMAQAVEMLEETVAAERRKRERQNLPAPAETLNEPNNSAEPSAPA